MMATACGGNELDRAWAGQDAADISFWPYFGDRWNQRSSVGSSLER